MLAMVVLLLLPGTPALAQSAPDPAATGSPGSDQARAEHELSRIAEVIGSLEREMRSGEADRTQASRALEKHERAIDLISREQRTLIATADNLTKQLARLRVAHETLGKEVEYERDHLAGELRVAYAMGHGNRAKLLLQRRDPGSIARLLRYHSYFTRAQRERIVMLEHSLLQLNETERAIADETRRLAGVHQRRRAQRRALEIERDLRATALLTLNAELADNRMAVERLKKDRQRLATLIARLRNAINDVPPESEPPRSFKALRGKLPWPVRGPLKRAFGSRRDGAVAMQGVLVKAPMGRRVRAIAHGRVVFADWLRGFGLMVIVDHGGGYMSLYGHNQSLQREPGEWIGAGDSLATVGDSGGKDGPGLYFEIRRDGRPENPARWCSRRAKFGAAS
jgi:septal ring factor EnvC (AmiA/AmiB activator)